MSEDNLDNVYKPKEWEKICAVVAAFWIIGLASFLIIRNQPFEPNSAVLMRILLSMGVAIFGAVIPGFLRVDLTWSGVVIRAGGALALFVLTYFFTPMVFQEPFQKEAVWESSEKGLPQLNGDFVRLIKSSADTKLIGLELAKLRPLHGSFISMMEAAEKNPESLSRPSKLVSLYTYLSMAYYQLAAIDKYIAMQKSAQVASQLEQEAISNAKACVAYAIKGIGLYNKILNTTPSDLYSQTNIWSESLYSLSQKKLTEYDYILDLSWYKSAGMAILSYYKEIPFEQGYKEVISLKSKSTIKDPPEDDPTMKWVLSSTDGKYP